MTRLSSLIILSAAAVALASPALAKISVQGAETLCKTHLSKQEPAPKSIKVDKEATRANGDTFSYLFKIKNADDSSAKLVCVVDRGTEQVASVTPAN